MRIDFDDLIKEALEADATHAAMADVSKIQFREEVRDACARNSCGNYDTNWMGPPAIGSIKDLMERARKYKHGLLFQTVCNVKSSFDLKGMIKGAEVHKKVFRSVIERIKKKYNIKDMLPLNAGCCRICKKCAYLDGEPCRNPDEAVSSVEAYGIDVVRMEKDAGMPYYNGKNTISYVGLILFNENEA
jgi:predicted metal-binding protein